MIMRLREPRRRRFTSHITARRKRQREYYYAAMSVLVVKIVLFIFLCILFVVSLRLFHHRFAHTVPPVRYAVPTLVAAFTIVLGFYIYRNIKEIVELAKEKREKRPTR
ncbi:MAG: hypothetical protein JSV33_15645 [bacterium]|nr:MAG: hypothetical protein JSV33_15645 [bacterium]